jgi:hypothetical protein
LLRVLPSELRATEVTVASSFVVDRLLEVKLLDYGSIRERALRECQEIHIPITPGRRSQFFWMISTISSSDFLPVP